MINKHLASIDVADIEKSLSTEHRIRKEASVTHLKKFKYADVKDKFTRVAFDLFSSSEVSGIWELIKDANGEEWLVCNKEYEEIHTAAKDRWKVIVANDRKSVVLSFDNYPLASFYGEDMNFNENTVFAFQDFLLRKVGEDQFVRDFVDRVIPKDRRTEVSRLIGLK